MARVTDVEEEPRTPFREWPAVGRWAVYVAIGLVVALLGASVLAGVVVQRSYPDVSGTLVLDGLDGRVDVRRDARGVPHIYADTSADLFRAQGYVQAQDRFWQMDVRRHLGSGRLSELLGEEALESDMLVRTMGWRDVAEQELRRLSDETVANLESFAAGVNHYLEQRGLMRLSLEYVLLGLDGLDYKPERWSPIDSLVWLKAVAWEQRADMADEADRSRLQVDRTLPQIAELYPSYGDPDRAAAAGRSGAGPSTTLGPGREQGANAWVVSGRHTTTGKPMLANDPHLLTTVPGAWYQTGLHCRQVGPSCPYRVSGFTWAGVPGVVVGHNERVAWALGSWSADTTDLYLEKLYDDEYLYGRSLQSLDERREEIRVHDGSTRSITVRRTEHGPLVSDVSPELFSVGANAAVPAGSPDRENGYAVALSWTGLQPGRTADALFALNRAGDWQEFREAASRFDAPAQLLYADVDGNIGSQAVGRVPVRAPGHTGDFPTPGWLTTYDWAGGLVPFEELPSRANPPEGYVVAVDPARSGTPGTGSQRVDRRSDERTERDAAGPSARRILDLLTAEIEDGKIDLDEMTAIQQDDFNALGPLLVPHLLQVLLPSQYYADGQRLLSDWDFQQDRDSAAAAYFNAVWRHLLRLTFHDQLRTSLWPAGGDRWALIVARLLEQPSNPWWDDVTTPTVVENRDMILAAAMRAARDDLTANLARDPDDWSWGKLHGLRLRNADMGPLGSGLGQLLLDRGPFRLAGGTTSVDATAWDARVGYDATTAPSMRMVVNLADLDASVWINATGASGHAFHDNYTDQTRLMVRGRMLRWPFSGEAVDRATRNTLRLEPR